MFYPYNRALRSFLFSMRAARRAADLLCERALARVTLTILTLDLDLLGLTLRG